MYMNIEKIDTFLGMLEAIDENKEAVPIFIKEAKVLDKTTGKMHAEVIVQAQFDTNMIIQHNITEGIGQVQNYPKEYLALMGAEQRTAMTKNFEDNVKHQDIQVETEKNKLIQILQGKGFKMFIPGVWQE